MHKRKSTFLLNAAFLQNFFVFSNVVLIPLRFGGIFLCMSVEHIECRVTGRVQMVMFRDFAQRKARKLGLCGFVRNNEDGSVTVLAEGAREKLEAYIAYLHKGSVLARVDAVEVEWKRTTGEYKDFLIVYA